MTYLYESEQPSTDERDESLACNLKRACISLSTVVPYAYVPDYSSFFLYTHLEQ